jgi:hypothetical protein
METRRGETMKMKCEKCETSNNVHTIQADLDTCDLCFSCWARYYTKFRSDVNLLDIFKYLSRNDVEYLKRGKKTS